MKKQDVPPQELRIALFGPSASGKSTFLASYFGNQQRDSFEEAHGYRLVAENIADGLQLLSRYYQLEKGAFPPGTERFVEYRFEFKLSGLLEAGLRVVWYDYPGGWWERDPKDASEKAARRDALSKLLTSHVGILLVDGTRYIEEGLRYVRPLFDQFRHEILRIQGEITGEDGSIGELPQQWVVALSKADLLPPGTTAEAICKDIVMGAVDQLTGLHGALKSGSFGCQYLLLSSVRGDGTRVVDPHQFIGLQLVAPIALVSLLSELAAKAPNGARFGFMRVILERISAIRRLADKVDLFLPPKLRMLGLLLNALAVPEMLDKGTAYFRKKQASEVERGNVLQATVAALRAELASPAAKDAFHKNQDWR